VTPRAGGLEPTPHLGAAWKIEKAGEVTALGTQRRDVEERNRQRLRKKPELLLDMATDRKSVFRQADLEKIAASYLDDATAGKDLAERALAHSSVVKLEDHAGEGARGKFTTKGMVKLEAGMIERALKMNEVTGYGAHIGAVRAALEAKPFLSDEQSQAVSHVTGRGRIAVVSGMAGAGKSTMLDTAREAWERSGYEVKGAALAGIAAQGLQESAAIPSRTLHSWEMSWNNGRGEATVPPLDAVLEPLADGAALVVTDDNGNLLMRGEVISNSGSLKVFRAWPQLLGVSRGGEPADVVFQTSRPLW
jgi:ATP-dependent exoDNAse (exonuclease V) alpha subunit